MAKKQDPLAQARARLKKLQREQTRLENFIHLEETEKRKSLTPQQLLKLVARENTLIQKNSTRQRKARLRLLKASRGTGFLQNVYIPLSGELKDMWLRGEWKDVLSEVKIRAGEQGKVQSIRLIIAGRPQKKTLSGKVNEQALYISDILPDSAKEVVDAFTVRVKVSAENVDAGDSEIVKKQDFDRKHPRYKVNRPSLGIVKGRFKPKKKNRGN